MPDLRAELLENLDEAEWEWLKPQVKTDTVIVVTPGLDLIDVGIAIAENNVANVQNWISEELIHKPTLAEREIWDKDNRTRFNALIVQPYVLVQEITTIK